MFYVWVLYGTLGPVSKSFLYGTLVPVSKSFLYGTLGPISKGFQLPRYLGVEKLQSVFHSVDALCTYPRVEANYVQEQIANYLNDLVNLGVAGFRFDAAKHMAASDMAGILSRVNLDGLYVFSVRWGSSINYDTRDTF